MQLLLFFRNTVRRGGLTLFIVASLVLFSVGLSVLLGVRILGSYSPTEIAGVSIAGIVVLSVLSLWEQRASSVRAFVRKRWRSSRPGIRILCLFIFFPVFSVYFLTGDEVRAVPATLEVGVIAVAAALGGLLLNAGLNLGGEKGREFILVAQKFIAVVILMLIFLPTFHLVDIAGGIDGKFVRTRQFDCLGPRSDVLDFGGFVYGRRGPVRHCSRRFGICDIRSRRDSRHI